MSFVGAKCPSLRLASAEDVSLYETIVLYSGLQRYRRVMSAIYTHGHDEPVLRSHLPRTAANSAGYLVPHLRSGLTVLDVGCGPGTITIDLADLVAPGAVTAIEPVPDALGAAQQAAGERSIRFEIADVHNLPYADGEFDVVHAHQVLQHVADPIGALREMRRVSRGLVAARDADYHAMTWYRKTPPWTNGWISTERPTGVTEANPTLGGVCCPGPRRQVSPISIHPRRLGCTRHPRVGAGGATCGLTAS